MASFEEMNRALLWLYSDHCAGLIMGDAAGPLLPYAEWITAMSDAFLANRQDNVVAFICPSCNIEDHASCDGDGCSCHNSLHVGMEVFSGPGFDYYRSAW